MTLSMLLVFLGLALIKPPDNPPPLPDPAGLTSTVSVGTVAELQAAVSGLVSNRKIVIQPGTYVLSQPIVITGVRNVAIRGATGDRDDVVIVGTGMTNNAVYHGIQVLNAQKVLVADLSVGQVFYHPITLHGEQGCNEVRVYNVRAFDGGQQLLKSNWNGTPGSGVDQGLVEYCVFEYTTTAPSDYTNGVDVHNGADWRIRHCRFRNIRAPAGQPLAGPAILMWSGSSNTVAEGNSFFNCERGIQFGLIDQAGYDHVGGIVRNNLFYRNASQSGDVGIAVADCPNARILHNTVICSGTYPSPIEYRWASSSGTVVANNLLDGSVWARDGATGTESDNYESASPSLFVSAAAEDFHLVAAAAAAIDQGVPLAECTTDWDDGARPTGAASDLGADEFGSAAANPPTKGSDGEGDSSRSCGARCDPPRFLQAVPIAILLLLLAIAQRRYRL